jgi:putative ABC transport system ATP-binding protein
MDDLPVMQFRDVVKVYPLPAGDVTALDGVSFQVDRGEFISVMGPSGSGKSTLLNLMGCLDTPTSGDIYISGTLIRDMSDTELTNLRRDRIGFIFQYFNLFPLLNIIENVTFPLMLKTGKGVDPDRGKEVLRAVQLDDKLFTHTPTDSSSGWLLPGRSSITRTSSSAMNRPATSIPRPGPVSWT